MHHKIKGSPLTEVAPDVSIASVVECISDVMPAVEERFKKLGHRQIRINLFVESIDPLPSGPQFVDSPVAMIPLYTKRIG